MSKYYDESFIYKKNKEKHLKHESEFASAKKYSNWLQWKIVIVSSFIHYLWK